MGKKKNGRMKQKKARGMRRILKLFLTLTFLFLAAAIAGGIFLVSRAPSIDALDAVPKEYRTSVLDDEKNVVLNLSDGSSNRVYVKLAEVPKDLQHAFVAIEDERFYKHHGVDLRGILRAAFVAVKNGGLSEGASTITQQLLKNNVFTDWTREKSLGDRIERKIQEQYLAVMLETRVSKEWILENYLNTINLGGGNWGVETASKYYFNKNVSDLNLAESAVLAGITKNPSRYNPVKNPEENRKRQEKVLGDMLRQGYISQAEYDEALAFDVYDEISAVRSGITGQEVMTYFEDALVTQLIQDLQDKTGCSEKEAWNQLYKGGLTVFSTENSQLQKVAEEEANRGELYNSDAQISLVMIDTDNGQVKALLGGRGEKKASLVLNRAVNGLHQPASAIKPLAAYAAGLEESKITLGTVYDDADYAYSDGSDVRNADGIYHGRMTINNAIASSNNIVALKCFQDVGMEAVWEQIEKFGIDTLTDKDKVESLALGGTSGGVTNLEMTAAYGALARGGEYITPILYTKVLDKNGEVLLEKEIESHQAVEKTTAVLLTRAMEDVFTEGTGVEARFEGMSLAGKSGTASEARDAWFIGFSPYLTCGVWGGNDDYSPQTDVTYIQRVWKAVMEKAHEGKESRGFDGEDLVTKVKICSKCGKLAISGICDSTVQGDMTKEVYFLPGTEPGEKCDCHEAVTICKESGQKAGPYCKNKVTKVYLKKASAGTTDEAFVLPANLKTPTTCQLHKHIWSGILGDKDKKDKDKKDNKTQDDEEQTSQEEESAGQSMEEDRDNDWWNSLFGDQ